MECKKPYFIVKKNLQKSKKTGVYFSDAVTPDVLRDVCRKITGEEEFGYEYVGNSFSDEVLNARYNIGRLAILYYQDETHYISFSEKEIGGRNSSIQSVPTAFNMYFINGNRNKKLHYYFINDQGNAETMYHTLIYRLMKTIGFNFLNEEVLQTEIDDFSSIEDLIFSRKVNSEKNRSNNSTYITKSSKKCIDVYGKTYGASKYETSMICYALCTLNKPTNIYTLTLYEILENDLKELPSSSLEVLELMGNIKIVPTDKKLEKKAFNENNSLRSSKYIYNLFARLGPKKCAFCDCEIDEIIQGAHIWPVSQIKNNQKLDVNSKVEHAISGNNGLWLCSNHHKLFDANLILISNEMNLYYNTENTSESSKCFMDYITTTKQISSRFVNDEFREYLEKRNSAI